MRNHERKQSLYLGRCISGGSAARRGHEIMSATDPLRVGCSPARRGHEIMSATDPLRVGLFC